MFLLRRFPAWRAWGAVSALVMLCGPAPAALAGGELVAGWEGDTERGYGYVSPSWQVGSIPWSTVTVSASDLYYTYLAPAGEIRVQSPGVAVGPDLRFRRGVTDWRIGAAVEARDESETSASGTTRNARIGPLAALDVYHGGDLVIAFLDASYGGAVHYTWARCGALRTLAPSDAMIVPGVGLELTGQGNADSQSYAAGILAQVAPRGLDAAVQLRLDWSTPSLAARAGRPALHAGVTFYRAFAADEPDASR